MNGILLLDYMAERYGCLPTEVLDRATTLDIDIYLKSQKWRQLRDERSQMGQTMPSNHGLRPEDLQDMMERVRSNDN